ncbi:MAG TPA: polysaccharide pyruvyl transferase family protein [Thermoleophilaceae bacterium]|jgi:hypothetical protein
MRLRRQRSSNALIVGWFSLAFGGATAGDLAALEVVRRWLDEAGWTYDVALGEPLEGGIDWRAAPPAAYSHVIHVCGPIGPSMEVAQILERFPASTLVAVNVSVIGDRDGFGSVVERDGRADLAFLGSEERVPVVGVAFVHHQVEYAGARHAEVEAAIGELLAERECASVSIDTKLDLNAGGLRSVAEVESLIARMDALVTTRLHGLVFALRSGVPALAVDPIAGGAKVAAQARAIDWPALLLPDEVDRLGELFDWCLGAEARERAHECSEAARRDADAVRDELLAALGGPPA